MWLSAGYSLIIITIIIIIILLAERALIMGWNFSRKQKIKGNFEGIQARNAVLACLRWIPIKIRPMSAIINYQSTPHCTLTFPTLFEVSLLLSSPSDPTQLNSHAFSRKVMSNLINLLKNRKPFCFGLTQSIFYGWLDIWFLFHGIGLAAKLLLVSF